MAVQRTICCSLLLTYLLAAVGANFDPTLNVNEALGRSGKVYYGQICEEGKNSDSEQICVQQREFVYGMEDGKAAYGEDRRLYEQFLHRKLTDKMAHPEETLKTNRNNPAISPQCSRDLDILAAAKELPFNYTWAFNYQDADAKDTYPDTGAFLGRPYALGSYDECVRIKATHVKVYRVNQTTGDTSHVGDHNFNAHYCHTRWLDIFDFNKQTGVGEGWCVPETCNREDVYHLMADFPDKTLPDKYTYCGTRPPLSSNTGAILTLCIVAFFVLLVIAATLLDGCKKLLEELRKTEDSDWIQMGSQQVKDELPSTLDTPGRAQRALLSFSLYRNIPTVLATGGTRSTFGCINGLRVIAMTWIVLGHVWSLDLGVMMDPGNMFAANYFSMWELWGSFAHQIITNIALPVDVFFFLGGTLVTYSFMKTLKRLEKQEPIARIGEMLLYVFHRYWRLTPLLAAIIMMYGNLWSYLSYGPLWPETNTSADNCRLMWWTNLLYINNLHRGSGECMGWTWYMANDFQFYLVVPIFAVVLYMSPFFGPIFLFLGWLGTTIARAVLFSTPTATNDNFWDVYVKPWARFGPYALGIAMGHIMYRTKGTRVKISRFFVLFGWLVAIGVGMLIVFGTYKRGDTPGFEPWSIPEQRAYNILRGDGFTLCVAWLVFACINGYGGVINSFLAWELWTPLSKLCYCGYLIHPIVHFVSLASREKFIYLQPITMLYWYLGNIVLTFISSFILTLVFEVPFMELEKVILPSKKRTPTPEDTQKRIPTVSSQPNDAEIKSPPTDDHPVTLADIPSYTSTVINDAQVSAFMVEREMSLPPRPNIGYHVGVSLRSAEFPPPPPSIAEDLVQNPATSIPLVNNAVRSTVVPASVVEDSVIHAEHMVQGTAIPLAKAQVEVPSLRDYVVAETRM